jgi:plastocyanin
MTYLRKGSVGGSRGHVWRTIAIAAGFVAALAGSVAAQNAGSISGQVTITERAGDVTEDLGNVVVFLEPIGATARVKSPAANKTVITLHGRQFQPRVRVVTAGSTVEFPNDDPFSHNVFSKMNGGFDTGVYGRGKTRDNEFSQAGVYPLYCNIHPRMTGFVIALPTSSYAQAGDDGRFTIDRVPAGRYVMHVWHDRAQEHIDTISVPSAALANMRVKLDARGYRYVQHKNKLGQDYTSASGDRY